MNEQNVAVLGLGLIGSIWAKHYADEGQLAACWSRSPKPDLPFQIETPATCAEKAQYIQLCLYDADSVREVLGKLLPHLGEQHTVIQSSTIDGVSAEEFSALVRESGASYLEAPFTGSKPAAEERKTVFFLGGEDKIVQDAEPILQTISTKRFHIGTPRQAASIKLAMNLQISGISQALCESITMSRDAGIADDIFFDVMKQNVAWSGLSALKEPKLRDADFSPQFSIKNMHKDMRLAKQTVENEMPLLTTIAKCLETAEQAGYGEDDFIALIRNLPTKS
ncbi:NAD(P)-dependent oxidoreductase [Coraliomargarita sinensis]|uniref:NAD(P)-dependent oxidoreductase n=1 Tax=Coraliomargarita sinensis TaxID=2174842 RepID=A0A317ZHZ2_9BACT|nr:NAD(P)-dependent oxidoreductase [Coraliomargarita sinensis]PXA05205.1 NAD(P)-dependent oxidoreductase [Coraliomargarita sinensis]